MADDLTPDADVTADPDESKSVVKPRLSLRRSPSDDVAASAVVGESESPTHGRKRYRVTPLATEKSPKRGSKTGSRRGTGATARGTSKKATRDPGQKKLPDDPDHQWLKRELRAADTVAQVLARQGQFENKIRALKLRHAPERPLYQYAERMEQLLKRLAAHPWSAQLRDIRQDDPQIRKLKL